MNKTLAGLLHSATAIICIGMAQPAAAAGNNPLTFSTVWVGDCTSGQVDIVASGVCNGKAWSQTLVNESNCYPAIPPGSNPPCTPYGGATDDSYYDAAYNGNYWAQQDVQQFSSTGGTKSGLPCASQGFSPVTLGTVVNPSACGSGSGGSSGGTGGGGWTIRNQGANYLVLMTPNNTVYKQDTYTNPATCQADEADLNNVCQQTKGCEPVVNKSVCQGG